MIEPVETKKGQKDIKYSPNRPLHWWRTDVPTRRHSAAPLHTISSTALVKTSEAIAAVGK